MGNGHATIRTPWPLALTWRLWASIQSRTSRLYASLRCPRSRAGPSCPPPKPLAAPLRNCVVMELTGLPSTNLIQVQSICADTARSRRGLWGRDRPCSTLSEEAHRVAHFSPGVRARPQSGETSSHPRSPKPTPDGSGKPYQPISSPFFRAYSGSGLSIQLLGPLPAHPKPCQRCPDGLATDPPSVIPSSKLTSAAIARVQSVPLRRSSSDCGAGYLVVPRSHSRRRRRGPPWDARSRA